MNGLLPIGSVVLLKDAKKRVMIIGRVQECNQKLYHYSGVLFPEGYYNNENMIVFNNSDIDTIYFIGLQDEEEFAFRDAIVNEINNHKEENNE